MIQNHKNQTNQTNQTNLRSDNFLKSQQSH